MRWIEYGAYLKKWVPAEEYGRTVNPGAAHHAAQQFLKSHDQLPLLIGQHVSTDIYYIILK